MSTFNKILTLLSRREQHLTYLLFIAMICNAVIELIVIASILPFISVVSDSEIIQTNKWLNWAYSTLEFSTTNSFLFFLGMLVLGILVLGNAFKAFVTWFEFRFIYMLNYSISRRILAGYLKQPYIFFVNRNTSDLGKNILAEAASVVVGLFKPGLDVMAKVLVALFILTFLLIINPFISISVIIVLCGSYALIYVLLRKRLSIIGEIRLVANKNRFKATDEAFGGIKELKVAGRERYFIEHYSRPAKRLASAQTNNQLIGQLPRLALEVVAFGSIIIIVLFYLTVRQDTTQVLPMITLYAFASYRLFPALQQIFLGLTKVRFNVAALDVLYNDFIATPEYVPTKPAAQFQNQIFSFNSQIKLIDICYGYPGTEESVIQHLNLTIPIKSTIGIVGGTGAGKTTIVDIVLGLLVPQSGRLMVDDTVINTENIQLWQKNLGYVPQNVYLYDETVAKNIAFGIPENDIDMNAVQNAAKIANIHDFIINELPQGYETLVGERGVRISGGQRQRIGIARSLYHDPKIIILDEATSALDGITEESVIKAINNLNRKKTIIKIAHRLTTVKDCGVIYVLEHGRVIAQGKYGELLKTCPQFRSMANI